MTTMGPDVGRATGPASEGLRLLARGRVREARERLWVAVERAAADGDAVTLADAAVGLTGLWVHDQRETLVRARALAAQRHALAGIDPASVAAGRLRVRLAAEDAYVTGDPSRLVAELDAARLAGRLPVVADALSCLLQCLLGPHHRVMRRAAAEELVALAPATGRPLDATLGLMWRTIDLFLTGDRRAARSLHELRDRLRAEPCDAVAYVADGLDVSVALRQGQLERAEQLADRARRRGEDTGDADAHVSHAAQITAIRWAQGRLGEMLDVLDDLDESPGVPELNLGFTAGVAVAAATAGATDVARQALGSLRAPGLARIVSSSSWLVTLAATCEAAWALGDAGAAGDAYAELRPFADLPIMIASGVACFGSAHRSLGLAAWARGELDRAVGHLEAAAEAELALDHRPARAISLGHLADLLDQRAAPGDDGRAVELRAQAVDLARRLGMPGWVERWTDRPSRPVDGPYDPPLACRRRGSLWELRMGGRVAVLRHRVGLGYLAALVDHAGTPVPVLDLVGSPFPARHGRQPMVDAAARNAVRRRVEELRADLDGTEGHADAGRAARARRELDQLTDEMARVRGHHGRARAFTDDTERARVAVQKALSRTVAAVTDVDPVIGAAIRDRLTTGAHCVFHQRPGDGAHRDP